MTDQKWYDPGRNKISYELVAISGDCSAHGMSDTADRLPVRNKYLANVVTFLRADLEHIIQSATQHDPAILTASNPVFQNYWAAAHNLLDIEVFKHKWHCRTSWALRELGDEYESLPAYCKAQTEQHHIRS